jgi:hypothetical protein
MRIFLSFLSSYYREIRLELARASARHAPERFMVHLAGKAIREASGNVIAACLPSYAYLAGCRSPVHP